MPVGVKKGVVIKFSPFAVNTRKKKKKNGDIVTSQPNTVSEMVTVGSFL